MADSDEEAKMHPTSQKCTPTHSHNTIVPQMNYGCVDSVATPCPDTPAAVAHPVSPLATALKHHRTSIAVCAIRRDTPFRIVCGPHCNRFVWLIYNDYDAAECAIQAMVAGTFPPLSHWVQAPAVQLDEETQLMCVRPRYGYRLHPNRARDRYTSGFECLPSNCHPDFTRLFAFAWEITIAVWRQKPRSSDETTAWVAGVVGRAIANRKVDQTPLTGIESDSVPRQ